MTSFSDHIHPLSSFAKYISQYEESIPLVIVKHSEGRHGSDKGCCEWCGVNNPNEFAKCTERTKEIQEQMRDKIVQLKSLYKIIKSQSIKKQKLIFEYIKL